MAKELVRHNYDSRGGSEEWKEVGFPAQTTANFEDIDTPIGSIITFQVVSTGNDAADGTATLEGSNDGGANFDSIAGTTRVVPDDGSASHTLPNAGHVKHRVAYVAGTNSTGTVDLFFTIKTA